MQVLGALTWRIRCRREHRLCPRAGMATRDARRTEGNYHLHRRPYAFPFVAALIADIKGAEARRSAVQISRTKVNAFLSLTRLTDGQVVASGYRVTAIYSTPR